MNDIYTAKLNAHYNRADHYDVIVDWLKGHGKDLDALTVEDLAPVDQFHGGQLASTISLAALAGISEGQRVADLGGGLGGPARYIAAKHGCHVDVVDLASELCRVGELLNGLLHMEDSVSLTSASATNSGLPSGSYDIVWMQNASMNIEDRPALYAEVNRLLKPNGLFVSQEILAGDAGPAYYPTNWASDQSESFLQSPEAVLRFLLDAGFRVLTWQDETQSSMGARIAQNAERIAGTAPPNYLSPEKLRLAAMNNSQGLQEGRLRSGRGLFQKL